MAHLIYSFILLFTIQTEWKEHEFIEEGFAIEAPSEVKSTEQEIMTDIGLINFSSWNFGKELKDGNLVYSVHVYAYPEGSLSADSSAADLGLELYHETMNANVDNLNGNLDYSTDIEVNGVPGMKYRISFNNRKQVMKSYAFIKEDTFYSLQVFTFQDRSLNDHIDVFLDSFRFIGT